MPSSKIWLDDDIFESTASVERLGIEYRTGRYLYEPTRSRVFIFHLLLNVHQLAFVFAFTSLAEIRCYFAFSSMALVISHVSGTFRTSSCCLNNASQPQ